MRVKYRTVSLLVSILLLLGLSHSGPSFAASGDNAKNIGYYKKKNDLDMLYVRHRKRPLNVLYKSIFTALENNGYFVVFEPNIGKNMSLFAERWGKDYNKQKLESIRSMVFCNTWYANKVANADPRMLALCPLHITLIEKNNLTTILFVRPGKVAAGSPAQAIATELEQDVIRIVENAL